jgi:hypothetical protein
MEPFLLQKLQNGFKDYERKASHGFVNFQPLPINV